MLFHARNGGFLHIYPKRMILCRTKKQNKAQKNHYLIKK